MIKAPNRGKSLGGPAQLRRRTQKAGRGSAGKEEGLPTNNSAGRACVCATAIRLAWSAHRCASRFPTPPATTLLGSRGSLRLQACIAPFLPTTLLGLYMSEAVIKDSHI